MLNGLAAVARRMLAMTWPEIREVLATVRTVYAVESVSDATHYLGSTLAERHRFTIHDGAIPTAASLAGRGTLHAKDLQDGQKVLGMTVRNPLGPRTS